MSSNIRITRLCQFCGCEFQAKTTVTKYCTDVFRIMALFQRPESELFLKSLGQALDYCESASETQGGFLICRNAKIMIRPSLAGEFITQGEIAFIDSSV